MTQERGSYEKLKFQGEFKDFISEAQCNTKNHTATIKAYQLDVTYNSLKSFKKVSRFNENNAQLDSSTKQNQYRMRKKVSKICKHYLENEDCEFSLSFRSYLFVNKKTSKLTLINEKLSETGEELKDIINGKHTYREISKYEVEKNLLKIPSFGVIEKQNKDINNYVFELESTGDLFALEKQKKTINISFTDNFMLFQILCPEVSLKKHFKK